MRPEPRILAFDTSAAHCAAALLCGDDILAETQVEMARGQAEALMPLLEEMLASQDMVWADLTALAVGIGPGNFTGIRISVAAARGLALGLNIPAVGVSNFEVLASAHGPVDALISLPAPRDQVYLQPFQGGQPAADPIQARPDVPPVEAMLDRTAHVVGHAAPQIAAALGLTALPATEIAVAPAMAYVATRKLARGLVSGPPVPMYVRPADAAPARDSGPVILP